MTPVTALAEALELAECPEDGEHHNRAFAEAILANLKGFVLVDEEGLAAALKLIEPMQMEEAGRPGNRTWFDVDRAWQLLSALDSPR